MWDNRIFNVNGRGKEMLEKALALSFAQLGDKTTCKGFVDHPEKGMILCWYATDAKWFSALPGMTAEEVVPIVMAWLKSPNAAAVPHSLEWDKDADHDGHNGPGWRVYLEDWGHVAGSIHTAICCVKPVCLWFGK